MRANYTCKNCGAQYNLSDRRWRCDCGSYLDIEIDLNYGHGECNSVHQKERIKNKHERTCCDSEYYMMKYVFYGIDHKKTAYSFMHIPRKHPAVYGMHHIE